MIKKTVTISARAGGMSPQNSRSQYCHEYIARYTFASCCYSTCWCCARAVWHALSPLACRPSHRMIRPTINTCARGEGRTKQGPSAFRAQYMRHAARLFEHVLFLRPPPLSTTFVGSQRIWRSRNKIRQAPTVDNRCPSRSMFHILWKSSAAMHRCGGRKFFLQ